MMILRSIKFRFTLWYLTILSLVLVVLGSGIYLTLADRLNQDLDNALKMRAEQLAGFREIISIVLSGTFEEEPGERISFYYYDDNRLTHISQGGRSIPADRQWIDGILNGNSGFSSAPGTENKNLRLYAMPYDPENTKIDPDQFKNKGPSPTPSRERKHRDRPGKRRHELERKPPPGEENHPPPGQGRRREPPPPEAEPTAPAFERRPGPDPEPRAERVTVNRAALIVARSTLPLKNVLNMLLAIMVTSLPLTLILAGGTGIFLLRRALKPVEQIANTARKIEEKDLSRRINLTTEDELGRLAATLNRMISKLEKAFLRQKELTGDASHELRAPLAVIQAEATLALQKSRDPSSYQHSLEIIAQESDHMSGIIRQLLTLARGDTQTGKQPFQVVDLAPFLKVLCNDVRILCLEKNQTLQLEEDEELKVNGNPKALRNLILNLLTNAIRYTPEKGKITVSLCRKNQMAAITVADTGIGIPAKALPHIFNRFYRVDKARSREAGGSGLGLAICRQIVDAHCGTIQAHSQVHQGSRFHVLLPLCQDGF